jgi:hypothetical protein
MMNARFYLRSSAFLLDKYLPDIGVHNQCTISKYLLLILFSPLPLCSLSSLLVDRPQEPQAVLPSDQATLRVHHGYDSQARQVAHPIGL